MKLSSAYDPNTYEKDIYKLWESKKAFYPKDRGGKGHYSIVVPPPNANGSLHLGHGLTLAIEDIAVRYHRMLGQQTLLLPGADHAGFETQVVYEKKLAAAGKSRFDYTRDDLYKQIWDFVGQNRSNYENQFRRTGASLDWDRYVFTLDKKIVERANKTFKKMWDEGLIYRGERLVNFCTYHETGFADIEVAYKEEAGHLWHVRYPLTTESDGAGGVVVATTRPETMLGDVAVAVHPKDKRYKHLHGKTVKLPLTNREIPIITDEFVDQDFGSGAVKITPAHDPNDFEVGQRHDLPMPSVITQKGTISHDLGPEIAQKYGGMTVAEARTAIVKDLELQDFLVKTEAHTHSVGHCYKCGIAIQPLLHEQWFVNVKHLARPAIRALKENKIVFRPTQKRDQLITYLENLRDWNISRQIAWGIPIPAFQNVDVADDWIFDERTDQEIIEVDGKTYRRDPDVFDTWFSSSSWPYATLDYPDGADFKKFYPLSLMETGADILFPWVSRMIMLGLYVTGEVPFREVYLHGLIQDEHGAKMSKSKGNVVDPMEKIDQFGSDAFRMGIIADEAAGQNRPYDQSKLVGARNFCNKLWNIARFVQEKTPAAETDLTDINTWPDAGNQADAWILSRLQNCIKQVGQMLDNYQLSSAYETLYRFVWDDFADWYIEAAKTTPSPKVLLFVLQTTLRLFHPFAPFITETIWQSMGWAKQQAEPTLATTAWPLVGPHKYRAGKFEQIRQLIIIARQTRQDLGIKKPNLWVEAEIPQELAQILARLAGLGAIKQVKPADQQGINDSGSISGLHLAGCPINAWLETDQQTINNYRHKLEQQLDTVKTEVKNLEKRLDNKKYLERAPKTLVKESRASLAHQKEILADLQKALSGLNKT